MSTSPPASSVAVRPFAPSNLADLHTINQGAVPGVNSLTTRELSELIAKSTATLVAVDTASGAILGVVLCLQDGLIYESLNYAWVSERYDTFAYIDRVAVANHARGRGVGRALYTSAFAVLGKTHARLLCEVNLEPPNPVSQQFHAALGFNEVGERWLPDRSKGVVYMLKDLR